MLTMAMPTSLEPARHTCYVPDYPVVIMDTGNYRYILDKPGGRITKEEVNYDTRREAK